VGFTVTPSEIRDVVLIEHDVFPDDRGFMYELFRDDAMREALKIDAPFVQDNCSRSRRNVLRGLHYQIRQPQGKLVHVLSGRIFDVVVDLRRSSATFGRWAGRHMSAEPRQSLWVPAGFAHGFLALEDDTTIIYKVTDYWAPQFERAILWNDPELGIDWPAVAPIVSERDSAGARFRDAELFD